jgi:muconolactone delta-isomerase
MEPFMAICTFKEGTAMEDVFAVVAEEQAQVKMLETQGRLGSIHLSLARGTVFIEIFADDEGGAAATVHTLPMSKWWDIDVYPLAAPVVSEEAS